MEILEIKIFHPHHNFPVTGKAGMEIARGFLFFFIFHIFCWRKFFAEAQKRWQIFLLLHFVNEDQDFLKLRIIFFEAWNLKLRNGICSW